MQRQKEHYMHQLALPVSVNLPNKFRYETKDQKHHDDVYTAYIWIPHLQIILALWRDIPVVIFSLQIHIFNHQSVYNV